MKTAWRTQALGDVCEIAKGRKPKLRQEALEGDLPYLVARVMRGSENPEFASCSDRNSVMVSEDETIIICDGSNSGEVFTGFRGILSSTMGKIVKKAEIDDAYLRAFLYSTFDVFNGAKTGAAIPHLDKEALYALSFSYPSLCEQRRIVAILDEVFEGIAIAKGNAEKKLRNARELFASRMQVLFEHGEAWERVQLSELLARGWITSHLDGNHGSDYPRKEEFVDAGVPYIAASAIRGGTVDFGEAKYLSPQRAATIRKGLAKDRDVLFAHNATVGPVAILSTDEDFVILGTSLTYYRCAPQHVHPEYLAHFMLSPAFTSQYAQVMKQSTRNQVPITKQREFFHVIPPIDVQRLIADDLDELLVQTERLGGVEMRKLVALDELKRSLLHQAFSGQLTAKAADKEFSEVV